MLLLADENIPLTSVVSLRKEGHDVVWVGEEFPGTSDTGILQYCVREQRILLTFDRDFGELVFRERRTPPPGIVYLRFPPSESSVSSVVNTHLSLSPQSARRTQRKSPHLFSDFPLAHSPVCFSSLS